MNEQMRKARSRREVGRFFVRLGVMAVFVWVLLFRIFGICQVPDNNMMPRLSAGDILLFDRLSSSFRASDIVVYEDDGKRMIGRIIAASGDTVEINSQQGLVINGSDVAEEYIYEETRPYLEGVEYPVQLGEDEYFVLCDRRDGARDSRLSGPVRADQIAGKVMMALRRSGL